MFVFLLIPCRWQSLSLSPVCHFACRYLSSLYSLSLSFIFKVKSVDISEMSNFNYLYDCILRTRKLKKPPDGHHWKYYFTQWFIFFRLKMSVSFGTRVSTVVKEIENKNWTAKWLYKDELKWKEPDGQHPPLDAVILDSRPNWMTGQGFFLCPRGLGPPWA